jgi:hypothetical protein
MQTAHTSELSGGRIVLLVAGVLAALLGLAVLAGGTVLLAANHTERDVAGFFSTGSDRYATDAYAIVSDDLDVGNEGPDWLFDEGRLATLRVRGASQDPGQELFIGIAPTSQVREFLAGTDFSTVTDLDFDPFQVSYRRSPGTSSPAAPAGESFWSASASGRGELSVEWDVAKGNWSAVVMNADASPGVDARLSLGAKVGFIFWLGLGLTIGGALLVAASAAMVYFSVRRPATALPAPPVSTAA